jgi:hypothetical protein
MEKSSAIIIYKICCHIYMRAWKRISYLHLSSMCIFKSISFFHYVTEGIVPLSHTWIVLQHSSEVAIVEFVDCRLQ